MPCRSPRTDLAVESLPKSTDCPGIETKTHTCQGVEVTHTRILDQKAAQDYGKPVGDYLMLDMGCVWEYSAAQRRPLRRCLSQQISSLITKTAPNCRTVLAVGLGNREVTPDALGPLAVHSLSVTGHLQTHHPDLFDALGRVSLSAIAPGVIGQTGMEAGEQIACCVARLHPDLILLIDALAARSIHRLCTSVQLTDTGIVPGSGVGNHRKALTRETLGVPVITIGVPTLIDSSTLIIDALEEAGIGEFPQALEDTVRNNQNFFVTRKDTDLAVEALADLISSAVNGVLFPSLWEDPLEDDPQ